jgi:hypothetical protein
MKTLEKVVSIDAYDDWEVARFLCSLLDLALAYPNCDIFISVSVTEVVDTPIAQVKLLQESYDTVRRCL